MRILTVRRTDTLDWWGFGLQISMRMSDRDTKAHPDELTLSDGRRLNVLVRGRMPECNGCRTRCYVKKNCPRAEHPKVVAKVAGEESVATEESVTTGSTAKVEPVEMEATREGSPPASSGSASPKVKHKRRKKRLTSEEIEKEAEKLFNWTWKAEHTRDTTKS